MKLFILQAFLIIFFVDLVQRFFIIDVLNLSACQDVLHCYHHIFELADSVVFFYVLALVL
jgi:hypothetical protein